MLTYVLKGHSCPVFWPGEFQGQRSMAGYSPWGCKESDTTDASLVTSGWTERKDSCLPGAKSAVTCRTLQMCVCGLDPWKSHIRVPWRELSIPDDTEIPGLISACFIYREGTGLLLHVESAPFSPDPATWGSTGF